MRLKYLQILSERGWSAWSKCSSTCGKGMKIRARKCDPKIDMCQGIVRDTKPCIIQFCPSKLNFQSNYLHKFVQQDMNEANPDRGTSVFLSFANLSDVLYALSILNFKNSTCNLQL